MVEVLYEMNIDAGESVRDLYRIRNQGVFMEQ